MITYPLRFLLILKEITMKAFSWAPPNAGTVPSVPMGEWALRSSALCCAFSSGLCTGDKGVGLCLPGLFKGLRGRIRWQRRPGVPEQRAVGTAGRWRRPPGPRGGGRTREAQAGLRALEARSPERVAAPATLDPLAPRRRGPGSPDAAHTTEGKAALGFFFPFSFAYNYSDGIIFF